MKPKHPFDATRFKVQDFTDNRDLLRWLIEEKHYLHKLPSSAQFCFGVVHDELGIVGAAIFGRPVRRNLSTSISPLVTDEQITELLRLFIIDGPVDQGFGCNLESWCITRCFDLLPPEKLIVVSYADPSARNSTDLSKAHIGRIYQATNGMHQKVKNTYKNYTVNLNEPGDTKWRHSRTMSRLLGRHSLAEMKRKIPHALVRETVQKYRYLWVLLDKALYGRNAKRRKRQEIIDSINKKNPIQMKYPKEKVEMPEEQSILSMIE